MQWSYLDIIGFTGAGLLLYAYWRNSKGSWKSSSIIYSVCNLIAAIILAIYSLLKGAYANVALNIVWGLVAIYDVKNRKEKDK